MLKMSVSQSHPGRSLDSLKAFCNELAVMMDDAGYCRLALALNNAAVEAAAAAELDAELGRSYNPRRPINLA